MTLRQALGALEQQGRLVRNKGRYGGTFVAEPKLELAGTSALSDQLRGLGLAAGARVLPRVERDAEPDERSSARGCTRSSAYASRTASPWHSNAARTRSTRSPACSTSRSTARSTS